MSHEHLILLSVKKISLLLMMRSCTLAALIMSNKLCNWLQSTPVVSKLGFATLIFNEPDIKVNGA